MSAATNNPRRILFTKGSLWKLWGEFSGQGLLLDEIPRIGFIENVAYTECFAIALTIKPWYFHILGAHYPNYQLGIGQLLIEK